MNTVEIPLTQGKVALIDEEDYHLISQYHWFACRNYTNFYAMRHVWIDRGNYANELMHVLIMGRREGEMIDHKNRNGLDNRRSNLRFVTPQQNASNRSLRSDNTSGYKGVVMRRHSSRWTARLYHEGRWRNLGTFATAEEAARAYDAAAIRIWGEYAALNLP